MTLWFSGNFRCKASYSKTSKLYSPDSGFQRCRSRCFRSHGAARYETKSYRICLENHPGYPKWLGSPPFISHFTWFGTGSCPTWPTKTNTMVVKHLLNGMILQSGWMQKCNSIGCLNGIASLGDVEVTNTSESMMASLEKNIPSSNLGSRPKKKTWSKKCRRKAFPRTPNLSTENICGTNYFQGLH